jgi:type II secretory pathway predicted ATPase ExeA
MYERYYGLTEKPFSLTPDPKFLYRSPSHANAFELLQYAIRRREGFVVVTGDIGTGKTTLCRALLEDIDRNTFTALVLNPFLSEEDLLKRILLDFGVISREDVKRGQLAHVTKQELIDTLYEFLLGLIPLKASAVLIIDEAQNLPVSVLEQIRILSNLETDKEKLLQIILVGQLNLMPLLKAPEMRQLDQRVSIRYQLDPLDEEGVASYIAHRLTVAGGSGAVRFAAKAVEKIHRLSGGIPRLINLICDRALLAGFAERSNRISAEMVDQAAGSLEVQQSANPRSGWSWLADRAQLVAGTAVVLLACAMAVGVSAFLHYGFGRGGAPGARPAASAPAAAATPVVDRTLPSTAAYTILVGAYPLDDPQSAIDIRSTTGWLESAGLRVYYAPIDSATGGRWQRVLAGAYADDAVARADADRLKAAVPAIEAQVVSANPAGGPGAARAAAVTGSPAPDVVLRRAGMTP